MNEQGKLLLQEVVDGGETTYYVCQNEGGVESIEDEYSSPIYGKVQTIVGLWGKENVTFDAAQNTFVLPADGNIQAQTYSRELDMKFHPTINDYSE